jgi:serine/threonine protein kinase
MHRPCQGRSVCPRPSLYNRASLLQNRQVTVLSPGALVGPYEVVSPLGAGGMGEVYSARDTKLSREVAIKVLPGEMARDPERLSRLRREATLLAALNHPHIAAIYGLEEADGRPFLVLELVEGEDLAERLKRGPVPVDEALEIARQDDVRTRAWSRVP